MLKKLLKYDLKHMYKFLNIFYILTIIFAITTRLINAFNETIITNIIYQISIGCLFSMIANIIINTIMRTWVRFKETIYGDESYLTHTLPVTKKDIFNSKFILALINLLTSFLVIVISLVIAFYTKDMFNLINDFITNIANLINMNYIVLIILFIVTIYIEIYNAISSGFVGIILGHKKENNKIAHSIIYGLITYFISQLSILLVLFITALFNKDIMNLFKTNTMDTGAAKYIIYFSIILYVIIVCIEKFIAEKELNKGINVE